MSNNCSRAAAAVAFALVYLLAPGARAQTPTFEYGKKEEVKKVEWKASAQAGLVLTTGNSRTTNINAAAAASRKDGNNKFEITGGLGYARSRIWLFTDGTGPNDGAIDPGEVQDLTSTTTRSWELATRYDRFLTKHNSLYAKAKVAGDKPAGKDFVGGGQLGYSRQLYKTDKHELKSEAGYDFSYEDLTAVPDGVSIHSGRVFVGYAGTLTADTGLTASLEFLANINSLTAPVENDPAGEVGVFEDRRTTFTLGITTKVYENVSFNFGFSAKHDSAPAPLPPAGGAAYADGYLPLAEELDTKTEANLIVNFL